MDETTKAKPQGMGTGMYWVMRVAATLSLIACVVFGVSSLVYRWDGNTQMAAQDLMAMISLAGMSLSLTALTNIEDLRRSK